MPDQYGYSTPDEVLAYRQDALASQGYSGVNDGSGNFYTQDYYDARPAALAANAQNTAATNASGMFGGVQNVAQQDAKRDSYGLAPGEYMNPYLSNLNTQMGNLSGQYGQVNNKLDQYGNQINSVNGALGQYGNQIGNLSNQYGSLSEKVNNFDSTLGQYGSQIGDISKALGQYGTQFGALSSQLNGLQTAQQAQTQAQKDYYAQQTAAQAARQQQYDSSLKNYGDAMTAQTQQGFLQNTMPQLRSGAQAAGQYGGSRQGIAEGVAAGNAATGLATNLASLYSQGYGANVNAGLQQQQLDNSMTLGLGNLGVNAANTQNSYNLGLGNLGVNATQAQNNYNLGLGGLANSNQAQNQNFYTQNRSLDQSGLSLGNQLYNSGVNGQLNLGNAQYNAGNIYQNAPLTTLQQYGNTISPYTGLNSSQVNTGSSGGGATGTLGGILAGLGITKNLGF